MYRQRRPVIWGHIPTYQKQCQREPEELNNQQERIEEQIPVILNHYPTNKPSCPPGAPSIPHNPPGESMPDCKYMRLAQAYIPVQPCNSPMFNPREALEKGTLYPSLYRPYPY